MTLTGDKKRNDEVAVISGRRKSMTEQQEAIEFAKILIRQKVNPSYDVFYCADNEFFVTKNAGIFSVTGYYLFGPPGSATQKVPFNIPVCKVNNQWYPAKQYVAPDTKRGSNFIMLWLLLSIGSAIMGLIMYFIISAVIK